MRVLRSELLSFLAAFRCTLAVPVVTLVFGWPERHALLAWFLAPFDASPTYVNPRALMSMEFHVLAIVAVCATWPLLAAEGLRYASRRLGVEPPRGVVLGVGLATAAVWSGALLLARSVAVAVFGMPRILL